MTTYWYDARPVVDPISGGSVLVPNADFTVHAYTDTALATPLTVQTRLGGVLGSTSELHSTPNGILDEFSVEDEWRVWLKSGEHVVLHTSAQGLADAAEASRVAAVAAQAAAEDAAEDAAGATGATAEQIDAHLGGPSLGLVNTVGGKADLDPTTGKVVASQIPSVTASDATAISKGSVQLAGDLGGTAAAPTVPALAAKADDIATVHKTGNESINGTKTFLNAPVVPDASFTPGKLSAAGAVAGQGVVFNGSAITWGTVGGGGVTFGTTAGTAAQGNDARIVGAAQKAANLSDLTSTVSARANLGLSNVNNTADADKPISTLTGVALAGKQATIPVYSGHPDPASLTPGTIYFLVTD